MLQTTNNVFNHTLYTTVVPESLLAWQRVRLANHLATDGKTWGKLLAKYNSGKSCNNLTFVFCASFTNMTEEYLCEINDYG